MKTWTSLDANVPYFFQNAAYIVRVRNYAHKRNQSNQAVFISDHHIDGNIVDHNRTSFTVIFISQSRCPSDPTHEFSLSMFVLGTGSHS